jgi:hypothetical protein
MECKVIKGFFKLSNKTTYNVGDTIELTDAEAKEMAKNGLVDFGSIIVAVIAGKNRKIKEPYLESKEGTKGIVTKLTPEEADAIIKEQNKSND